MNTNVQELLKELSDSKDLTPHMRERIKVTLGQSGFEERWTDEEIYTQRGQQVLARAKERRAEMERQLANTESTPGIDRIVDPKRSTDSKSRLKALAKEILEILMSDEGGDDTNLLNLGGGEPRIVARQTYND